MKISRERSIFAMVLILGDEKTHLMSFIATCKHATGLLYPTMFVPRLKTLDFNAGPIVTVSVLFWSGFSRTCDTVSLQNR